LLLAQAAGVGLGKVVSITEGGGFAPPVPMYRMQADTVSAPVPMAEGEVAMAATVTMVWEIAQ
ncbi:MAG TPA: SIMPL domain-containing protein, partial [Paracoccaceae bacterium]